MLYVEILRGKDKIGENLIEATDGKSKILLECGVPLEPTAETAAVERRVLQTEYDAVVVTHYHQDHCGLLKLPLRAKEIYLGRGAYGVLKYCKAICKENEPKLRFMESERRFFVGGIECTPYLCDHSAYDSYMAVLKAGGKTVLYTGDFRANGRKNYQSLLSKLPQNVDRLIVEGTKPTPKNATEKDVEAQATRLFQKYDRAFVLQGALNVDRTVSFYRASKRTGKPFLMRLSAADVCRTMKNIPQPARFHDCFTYLQAPVSATKREELRAVYGDKLLGRGTIAKLPKFTMQVHAGMLPYLQKLASGRGLEGSVLVYSTWSGYKPEMQTFLDGVKGLGIETVDLHVSGHADVEAVRALLSRTNPARVELVHTRAADRTAWTELLRFGTPQGGESALFGGSIP